MLSNFLARVLSKNLAGWTIGWPQFSQLSPIRLFSALKQKLSPFLKTMLIALRRTFNLENQKSIHYRRKYIMKWIHFWSVTFQTLQFRFYRSRHIFNYWCLSFDTLLKFLLSEFNSHLSKGQKKSILCLKHSRQGLFLETP